MNLQQKGGNKEKGSGESEKVLVAVKASKEIPKAALVWALTHVVQPGDCITLLVVAPQQSPGRKLWGFPRFSGDCASGHRKSNSGATLEQKCEITDNCSQMILQLHDVYDPNKKNVKIRIVTALSCGVVAAEAKKVQANWVILDKQLKHEERRCMEELHCNIVVMKRSQAKFLRLNLVGSPTKDHEIVSSLHSEVEEASMEHIKGKDNPLRSIRGPIVTPSSSPELFTATEVGTSSVSSSDPGTSQLSVTEMNGNLKKEDSVVTKESGDRDNSSSDTDSEGLSPCSTSLGFQPWILEHLKSHHQSSQNLEKRSTNAKNKPQNSPTRTFLEKYSKLDQEAGTESSFHRSDISFNGNVRKAISLSRIPLGPPPLCSICQHKAPVFGKPPRWFSYSELEVATGGFSKANFLAEGGFGSVHRGVLPDGQAIAVKQHKLASSQGDVEFCSEVEVLSCAQHRNVVMLIGYCIENKRRLLVYEYICNGSLDAHLYGRNCGPLGWYARHKIAVGAARGLRYLHEECRVGCIVHRDMRPNNILLTHDYEPLVGDFGLARWQPDGDTGVETRVIGTFGYLAPEYAQSGQITEKADVYSFGVVLVELLTGRKAVDLSRPKGQQCLTEWARPLLQQYTIEELIDPRLGNQYSEQEVYCMMQAASFCIQRDPHSRPRMSQVLRILEGDMLVGSSRASTPGYDGSRRGRMCSDQLPLQSYGRQSTSEATDICKGNFSMDSIGAVLWGKGQGESDNRQRMEGKGKFLHGVLEVTIFHATPCKPSFPFGCLSLYGKKTYVSIKIDHQTVARTSREKDRVWNQTYRIMCAHPLDSTIIIAMKTSCYVLGKIHFQANQLVNGAGFIHGCFSLLSEDGKPVPNLQLQFILWFRPVGFEPCWRKLIGNSDYKGLKNTTFPQRSTCSVVLYHDTHHFSTFRPPLDGALPGGGPRKLWEDVYKALEGARHLIYIAGWSLNPMMVLVRDPETDIPHARGVKLSKLLRQKAEEGVAVRIMLWDDETSIALIKNKGLMRTHDEDAVAYFRNTKVVCRLCPRLHNIIPTLFSHHQKTITVDTRVEDTPSNREIMSFVGGVDLCDGRYDTEDHSLFRTLNTESHVNDFYQVCIEGATLYKGGPRQPWHDAHACIRGTAAFDILTNFEQRWTKQCDPSLLIPATTIASLFFNELSATAILNRNWAVQVFRSLDHFSASPLSGKFTTEQSIHEAYVEAIRRAERFIYIENQYFTGGCSLWENDRNSGCRNLIPIEIALKVVEKIRAKERFAAYIVIPMWPEGAPESQAVEDILHWTRETMTMMYKLIGEVIKEVGDSGHPKDYLNFFCLANREEEGEGEFVPPFPPHPSTHYWNAQRNRRFMVYVHSKLMIVDDIYMLIGSANINQRSMDGARDTEIAIGCYQIENDEGRKTNGNIYTYRMSLWYEHTRRVEDLFQKPHSLECMQRLRFIGDEMWQIYSRDEVLDMKGVHLVSYPITVNIDGSLEDLVGFINFPDTDTPVKGRRSKILPPILTT
ncbi:hypothetical protein Nepgr_017852 [Nepenthes gracilis]|uniref:phospholipase D n=1 Tax=Nepenthes gracilis TaxID=150966 RepID=A0AAD3STH1_NEPGR|nr:hypothetical protein Nepgr_017852 [Nepenthes gracilis]